MYIHPILNKKFQKKHGNQVYMCEHKIDICAMLSVFYIGTGNLDIVQVTSIFSILADGYCKHSLIDIALG